MFEYPIEKYHFFTSKNKIVAVSTYAGKSVRGVAKCDPRDEFDMEKGRELAAARCAERVAQKRLARARKEFSRANEIRLKAQARFDEMNAYLYDAKNAVIAAEEKTSKLLQKM